MDPDESNSDSDSDSEETEDYEYLGCYTDAATRDLAVNSGMTNAVPNTCAEYCTESGYTYFGLQYHGQCFCDNDFGSYGESSNCDKTCTADPTVICGGGYANSVYQITGAALAPFPNILLIMYHVDTI